jgi:hypothetical protein
MTTRHLRKRETVSSRPGCPAGASKDRRLLRRVTLGLAVIMLVACGAPHSATEVELSEDCTSYLTSYRACLGQFGSASVADKRIDAMRASLLASSREESARAAVDSRCRSAKQDIDSSCR